MRVGFYAVRDMKSGAFMAPFTLHTDGMAIRAFGDAVRDKTSMVSMHPEDFELYRLGYFDDHSGVVLEDKAPLAHALDFVVGVEHVKEVKSDA